jgi:phosphatidyl-myo-inositol dimannoside synthase
MAAPRVLIITPDFPPAPGGIQIMAHRLAAGMKRLEPLTVTLDCPGAAAFDAGSSVHVRRVRGAGVPGLARNALLNAAALREASRFRPAVTLSMHIVTSPAAAVLRRLRRTPVAQYFHAKEIPARPRLSAFAAAHADAVIAVSSYCAELISTAGGVPRDLRVIPPGVDIPADPAPEPSERPTIVTVARLEDRYKGHDVMVRALSLVRAKVPDVEWVVVGDGSLRTELEARVRAEGLSDSVRFLGAVSDEQRDGWLRRADVVAMPSRLPADGGAGEGFGIAFMEAAAHGRPVVAGNVGGALDSVVDGVSGMLVDPRDPQALAAALSELLLDRDLAARLGNAGAVRARDFAWPLIAARLEGVLLELLHAGAAGPRAAPTEPAPTGV